MSCKVTSGVDNSCTSRLKVSGLGKKFWLTYKSLLDTQISTAQAADINTLDFGAYGGLYAMEGSKFSHDYSYELKVASGGTISYDQIFNWKLMPDTTADDLTIQQMNLGDDIIIIVETLNREFLILGAGNGMSATAATGGSGGKESGGDSADSGTLIANETTKPLRFALGSGYDGTLAYLESFEL